MLERLVAQSQGGVRLRALGGTRAGEMRVFRFLHNERVTPGAMIDAARARTLGRVPGRHVLALQDTTSLRDESNTSKHSLHLHPTLAVDAADGTVIGLVDAQLLTRVGGQRGQKKQLPFAAKQSRRWLDATIGAAALRDAGASQVTVIADRESDVYETFALRPPSVDLLIRANHDRAVAGGGRLEACLDGLAALGCETIDLPAGPGRKARTAVLALKAQAVTIKAPARSLTPGLPPEVALWVVQAREVEPPPGVDPANWLLLTTHPVPDLAAARQLTGFYRQRWTIEQAFRIMKTQGFDIEASQVGEGGPFENLAMATLIAATQVLQMVRERDGAARRPMTDVFEPDDQPAMAALCTTLEGKTARQKNPHAPGTLAWSAWICARLGGWTGYYGKPGPITIHRGKLRLMDMVLSYKLARLV